MGLTAAILCPGPSLASLIETPKADVVIGVNRAVIAHRCHWWAVIDPQSIVEIGATYAQSIFTPQATIDQGERYDLTLGEYDVLTFEAVKDPPVSLGWTLFSTTAAIALAFNLGARLIEAYGSDLMGEADYDGHRSHRNTRTETRWAVERARHEQLKIWLAGHGAELIYGTP